MRNTWFDSRGINLRVALLHTGVPIGSIRIDSLDLLTVSAKFAVDPSDFA